MIADIDKDVSDSNLISFADNTRLYSGVGDVTDCNKLQFDLDTVYDWASSNNMFFNSIFLAMFLLALMGLLTSQMYIMIHQLTLLAPPLMWLIEVFPCPATVLLIFTFLICTEDAQILLAGY